MVGDCVRLTCFNRRSFNHLHRPTIDNLRRSLQCSHQSIRKITLTIGDDYSKLRRFKRQSCYSSAQARAVGFDLATVNPLEIPESNCWSQFGPC